jgi:hypothetical protein
MPDFLPFEGTRNSFCSLLDINPAYDLDSNPADGIVDDSTATLVGRVPRAIPGRPGSYVCAIAPAGGFVQVKRSNNVVSSDPIRYKYVADAPNTYMACGAGGYLYRLGAVNAPGDATSDFCLQCPRGSYASSAASLCIACPVNNYQDKPGQRACKPCQYGYAPTTGATRCMGCYYGRPYCSEGYTPNEAFFTCNSERLPEGYSPEAGFSVVRPLGEPTAADVAAKYAPMFRNCNVKGGAQSLVAFNVSAECKVDMYVLGDLGRNGASCSQSADANSISAYYTAPNMLAGFSTPGANGFLVGFAGVLDGDGLASRVFAAGRGKMVGPDISLPTDFKLVLPESGWSYLGGGDNGQGQNANLKGVNFDPCPPGTVKETLNGDGVDDPAEDPNKLLNAYCVPCSIGAYCPGKDASAGAQNCPAGTFGSILGAKDANGCVNCPIGTYQDADGASSCMTCPPNTFASAAGATQCTLCGDGYEISTSGSNFCNPCSPGTYRDSTVSETCQECPAGTSAAEASGQCSMCAPGTYAATPRSGACTECPRGSYQRSYGQKKCELCPQGTYSDSRGRSSCKVCPVGTANPDTGSQSATACQRCPVGKAAPRPGSSTCSACGAGYFSDRPGMGSCRACPAGTYSNKVGSMACTPCPKGQYADAAASRGCSPCPIGFFSATTGAARCMSCPAGAFTSQTGASSCERCQPGTYSTRSAASSDVTCAVCPAGSYSYMEGATQCLLCPAGQFAANPGSTSCDVCPLGMYSSGTGSQRCLPCKDGFTTASMGATGPGDCSVRVVLNAGPGGGVGAVKPILG